LNRRPSKKALAESGSAADYGKELLKRLSWGLTARFGRGFSQRNLKQMRLFYLGWRISQTLSAESNLEALSSGSESSLDPYSELSRPSPKRRFPLLWSHYVSLITVKSEQARSFYEAKALRGEWSVRQLDRQIGFQFYERMAFSCNKAAMLRKGREARPQGAASPEDEIKDPCSLEDEPTGAGLEKAQENRTK
jgi:hypothetical protein